MLITPVPFTVASMARSAPLGSVAAVGETVTAVMDDSTSENATAWLNGLMENVFHTW